MSIPAHSPVALPRDCDVSERIAAMGDSARTNGVPASVAGKRDPRQAVAVLAGFEAHHDQREL